jgi:ribosomal protein L2
MQAFKKYYFLFGWLIRTHSICIVMSSGRNFSGRICVQHQGGAKKNRFFKIDRFRQLNQFGYVCRVLKHFYFSGYIGLIIYSNGLANFILLSEGLKIGFLLFSGSSYMEKSLGSTCKLLNVKLFDSINSVEYFPFAGFKIARSAGVFSYVFSKNNELSTLKMPSG